MTRIHFSQKTCFLSLLCASFESYLVSVLSVKLLAIWPTLNACTHKTSAHLDTWPCVFVLAKPHLLHSCPPHDVCTCGYLLTMQPVLTSMLPHSLFTWLVPLTTVTAFHRYTPYFPFIAYNLQVLSHICYNVYMRVCVHIYTRFCGTSLTATTSTGSTANAITVTITNTSTSSSSTAAPTLTSTSTMAAAAAACLPLHPPPCLSQALKRGVLMHTSAQTWAYIQGYVCPST